MGKNKNKDSNNDSNNNNDPYGSNGGSNNGYMGGSNNGGYPGGGDNDDCKEKTSTTCDFDKGFGDISGKVAITQYDCNGEWEVRLEGDLSFDVEDLSDSLAFHVHQNDVDFDDDTKTCSDAGGHFEVSEDEIHGPPWFALPDRHHGDLGNINTTDSKSKFTITDKIISLDIDKDGYIGKRVIIVHAAPDDFNPTRDPDSTGNAGARLGCCRIKAPPKIKNKNKDSNNDSNNNNDPYGSNGGSNNGYMGGSNNGGYPGGGDNDDCKEKTSTTCDFDKGFGDISGKVAITQYDCNGEWEVRLEGDLSFDVEDLSDSLAFHVHQNDVDFDDDTKTCSDAGGHFEVSEDEIHGPPWFALPDRHHGDLGNINTTDSKSTFKITDKIISLDSNKDGYIGKRVIVVHAAPDDFNPTRDPDSTGNAGARLGCCRIKAPKKIKNKNKDDKNNQKP